MITEKPSNDSEPLKPVAGSDRLQGATGELDEVLSKRAKYGLKALTGLADAWPGGPILIADLARTERIPLKFLENILLRLKQAGYLVSKKGRGGGYALAVAPDRVMVGEVVRLLDGPLALVPCASLTAYRPCGDCEDESACGIRSIMKEVRDVTAAILDRTSLEDLRRRERRGRSSPAAPTEALRRSTPARGKRSQHASSSEAR